MLTLLVVSITLETTIQKTIMHGKMEKKKKRCKSLIPLGF